MDALQPRQIVKGCAANPLPRFASDNPLPADVFAEMKAYSDSQDGAGLMVLIDGKVAGEAYREGVDEDTRAFSFSMHKSVMALAYGAAIEDGYIGSIDDPIGDYIEERADDWFGAEALILTNASSKTAMGLASTAKQNSPETKRIGVTSEGNADFTEETGLYDKVITYGEIGNLPIMPSVVVDFAGNAEVLAKVHEHFGDCLKYSCLVGVTHIDDRGLPGAKPTLFFAPDHAVALFKAHGPAEAGAMLAKAWQGFLSAAEGTVAIEEHAGLEAARATYLEMIGGHVDPSKGIMIKP
ncbi:MAG: DUF2855 family protein [Marinomonas sp.]